MCENVCNKGRHLVSITYKVGIEIKVYGNRREDTVITRICIRHPNLNFSLHLIGKSESDCCNYCGIT